MSVATVHVVGRIVAPDGTGVAGGTITFTLSVPGRVEDSGETGRVARAWTFPIDLDGAVDFNLIPNDAIDPAGTWYDVTYAPTRQPVWSERVQVTTLPAEIEIGDLDVIGEVAEPVETRFRPPLFPTGIVQGPAYDGWIWRVPGIAGVSPGALRTCLVNGAGNAWEFIDIATGGP